MSKAAAYTAAAMLTEARGLLLSGWCRDAQARDRMGNAVPAWSDEARSWSLLGALLASSYGDSLEADFVAHSVHSSSLGEAIGALGEVIGMADLEQWNNEPGRNIDDVLTAVDRAADSLNTEVG